MRAKKRRGVFDYRWKRFYGKDSMRILRVKIKYEITLESEDFNFVETIGDEIWISELGELLEAMANEIPLTI